MGRFVVHPPPHRLLLIRGWRCAPKVDVHKISLKLPAPCVLYKFQVSNSITRIIERTLKGSYAIDTEALCILAGKSVWSIRVDVTVLDNDGNVLDCSLLAVLLALLNCRRPVVSIQGDDVIVHPSEEREPVPLSIHHIPVCLSYALFDESRILVADPTLEEERCSSGHVVIGMNTHNEICLLDYPGGCPIQLKVVVAMPSSVVTLASQGMQQN